MNTEKHVIDHRADFLAEEEKVTGSQFLPADPMDIQAAREGLEKLRLKNLGDK